MLDRRLKHCKTNLYDSRRGSLFELPNAPHHVHRAGGQVEGVQPPPDLETVLKEIEGYLGINS
jgi:hypothetical protein